MQRSRKRMMLALASVTASGLLAGCATLTTAFGATEAIDTKEVACAAFKPITWSTRDTDETIAEVREHNAAYAELCT